MSKELRLHFAKHVELTEQEFAFCQSFFQTKRVRKHTLLLQEGEVCKYFLFVASGCLRAYAMDRKGEEHIVHFAFESWWITDDSSFWTGAPAIYFIEALEDSELLMIDAPGMETLLQKCPKLERHFRILLTNHAIALDRRIAASLSLSAEENYLQLLKVYPQLAQRVSLKHISSYLGITPESLSRIRKRLAKRPQKS